MVPTALLVYGSYLVFHGMGLHSSTFQLNLSRFRHKIHPRHPLISPTFSHTPPE